MTLPPRGTVKPPSQVLELHENSGFPTSGNTFRHSCRCARSPAAPTCQNSCSLRWTLPSHRTALRSNRGHRQHVPMSQYRQMVLILSFKQLNKLPIFHIFNVKHIFHNIESLFQISTSRIPSRTVGNPHEFNAGNVFNLFCY